MKKKKKKIVILSGAGISAESGIPTFRSSDGLWEGYNVMEVATPEGWKSNPKLVLEFYNERRKKALHALPNVAHTICATLESHFEVQIITQNVDDLHEKGGASHVLHLHGELFKSRSTFDPHLIYPIDGWELNLGDQCEKGSQLRPHIVWFGEEVPLMRQAVTYCQQADLFVIIGTSLQVYPAASLIDDVPVSSPKFIIDPHTPKVGSFENLHFIEKKASSGMQTLKEILLSRYQ